jgi:hypothetical protein
MRFPWKSIKRVKTKTLITTASLWLILSNCTPSTPPQSSSIENSPSPIADARQRPSNSPTLWSDGFAEVNWQEAWNIRSYGSWGLDEVEVIAEPSGKFSRILRVRYPAGSASPSVSRSQGVPLGGTQFYADLGLPPRDALHLSYYLRFSDDFDFVKGGKLPGLFGGKSVSGGNIPDGTDGFSTRFMWRRQGDGEVYAYLPTSENYGTSIGRGAWQFQPGTWYHVEQEVVLNQPDQKDGQIRVWIDGKKVLDREGLQFRTTDKLKIEGIFFSTFFGGGDPSWSTPKDVYADFAEFSVSPVQTE